MTSLRLSLFSSTTMCTRTVICCWLTAYASLCPSPFEDQDLPPSDKDVSSNHPSKQVSLGTGVAT